MRRYAHINRFSVSYMFISTVLVIFLLNTLVFTALTPCSASHQLHLKRTDWRTDGWTVRGSELMRDIISLTKLAYFQEGTNRIIFAYGNADPSTNNDFHYHGTNRGTKSLFLLNPDRGVSNIRPTERVHTLDFLNDNVRPSRHLYIVLYFQQQW